MNLDISNCQSLTDQSCTSIARHCVSLEFLGMRNMKDMTGHTLSKMFQDEERASVFQGITLSGSKNVLYYQFGGEGEENEKLILNCDVPLICHVGV